MDKKTVFVELLRTVTTGKQFSADIEISASTIDGFVRAGLAPLLCSELDRAGLLDHRDPSQCLRAAAMTSRVLTRELIDNACDVVAMLRSNGIPVVVLKGFSYATRYYSEPHLRLMGDLDLLLTTGETGAAEDLLMARGFQPESPPPDIDYDRHIHSAPMFSSQRQLWVEPHRRLIPDTFEASQEAPLDLRRVNEHVADITVGCSQVPVFSTEFEVVYLATGWYRDLAFGFDDVRSQRGLVDLAVMLQSTGDRLDWEPILRWSEETQTGACLYFMLSFLVRLGVYADADGICRELRQSQPRINSLVTATIHDRLEKHVLTFGEFGRFARASVNQQLFSTLVCRRAAWQNLLHAPWDLAFPPDQDNRYEPRRLLRRLSKVVRA